MADKAAITKQAQKFVAKGQTDRAISVWKEFVEHTPDGNIYNTIGDLYLRTNNKKDSIDWFHKASNFFRDEGFSLKSLAICKKILNIDPSDPQALLSLGELNEEKGLIPDAIKFYLASIDTLSKRKQKDHIINIYNKILNIAPSNVPLRTKIAEFFVKEGLHTDASKEFIHIARLYEEKGKSDTAVEYFNKAIEIYPQNKDAYVSMSKLYETLGKKDKALNILNLAINSFPDETDLKLLLVDYQIKDNKFDDAKNLLKQIAEQDPDNISVKEQIANIHLLKGNKEKAWEIYGSIVNELLLVKKPPQIIEMLKQFSELEPVEVKKKLASLYKEIGEMDNAFREFLDVGILLRDSGMNEEAMNILSEAKQIHPEREEVKEVIASLKKDIGIEEEVSEVAEKSAEEGLTEVEVLLRYGQTEEAKNILESLKAKEPENIEVNRKLKSLYVEIGDKELAVTQCILLAGLFEKEGDLEKKEHVLNEAFDIDPQDPRLVERAPTTVNAESSLSPTGLEETSGLAETHEDQIAEADFYLSQGLTDEALKIYQKLQEAMPGNDEIKEKINTITSMAEAESPSEAFEESPLEEEVAPLDSEEEFEDFVIEDTETMSAEEIPEPTLQNEVLEIFEEFKKGIESELDEKDSETHYNLGIAYKEMGLVDDAIKEFQTANKDPKRTVQSSTMLGICYMEKGLYQLAIEVLQNALSQIATKDDSYWGTTFDLAEAYEKNGNIKEAMALYTEIYSYNSKFRNVDGKVNKFKAYQPKEPVGETEMSSEKKKKKDRISYI